MTNDDLQLLREFRAEVPAPSEEARRTAYTYATRPQQHPSRRSLVRRPRGLVPAALAGAVLAASLVAAFTLTGGTTGGTTTTGQGIGSLGADTAFSATLAQPLPNGRQISLADAPGELGAPVTLPSSSLVQPFSTRAGLGGWPVSCPHCRGHRPVTGPDLRIRAATPADPSATYQGIAEGTPNIFQFIHLNGVPALVAKENSDDTGQNFGSVTFVSGGVEIRVMGHNDTATLTSLAQSILAQMGS